MIALYSIKPIYTDQIMNGSKVYELRRRIPVTKLDFIIIYSTSPVAKVVGYAEIQSVHKKSVDDLWKLVSVSAGIERNDYLDYFHGCNDAFAIELCDVRRFVRPFELSEISPSIVPPQSFSYVDPKIFTRLSKRRTELV